METISSFTGQYEFLSMTYNSPIIVDGLSYTNAESAFYAQRIKDVNARAKLSRLSGNKARAKALQATPIDDWEETKDQVMKKILLIKFSDEKLKKKLLSTKGKRLNNVNSYRDEYWGIYMGKGKNKLGRILEIVREELSNTVNE